MRRVFVLKFVLAQGMFLVLTGDYLGLGRDETDGVMKMSKAIVLGTMHRSLFIFYLCATHCDLNQIRC